MSVMMEFSIFPVDKGESVGAYVARVIDMLEKSGYTYRLTPMGTIVETGELKSALSVVEKAFELLEPDCNRVYCTVKLDIRKGTGSRMEQKIKSVEDRIGKKDN